jgi:hypothetical protein
MGSRLNRVELAMWPQFAKELKRLISASGTHDVRIQRDKAGHLLELTILPKEKEGDDDSDELSPSV